MNQSRDWEIDAEQLLILSMFEQYINRLQHEEIINELFKVYHILCYKRAQSINNYILFKDFALTNSDTLYLLHSVLGESHHPLSNDKLKNIIMSFYIEALMVEKQQYLMLLDELGVAAPA
jgi:hypothetical protein